MKQVARSASRTIPVSIKREHTLFRFFQVDSSHLATSLKGILAFSNLALACNRLACNRPAFNRISFNRTASNSLMFSKAAFSNPTCKAIAFNRAERETCSTVPALERRMKLCVKNLPNVSKISKAVLETHLTDQAVQKLPHLNAVTFMTCHIAAYYHHCSQQGDGLTRKLAQA